MAICSLLDDQYQSLISADTGRVSDLVTNKKLGVGASGQVFLVEEQLPSNNSAIRKRLVKKQYEPLQVYHRSPNQLSSNYQQYHYYFSPDFLTELNVLQTLKSVPGIVTIHGMCLDMKADKLSSSLWLEAMDSDLEQLATSNLSSRQRLNLLPLLIQQIGEALCALHSINILHNDLKPHNILVSHVNVTGQASNVMGEASNVMGQASDAIRAIFKLADFGISVSRTNVSSYFIGGSLIVQSPEALLSRNVADYNYLESDMWSLGICCLLLLTGQYFLFAYDPLDILRKIHLYSDRRADDFEAFGDAVLDGTITGAIDVPAIIADYGIEVSEIADNINTSYIDKVTAMLQLNPAQRLTDQQLSSCSNGDGDSGDELTQSIWQALPGSYPQPEPELWSAVRSYFTDAAAITMAYELALRLLSVTGDRSYVESSIPLICCLTDCYLFKLDISAGTPIDVYQHLAGYSSQQQFLSDTVELVNLLQGRLYNYHCADAVETLGEVSANADDEVVTVTREVVEKVRLPAWYQPTSHYIRQWFDSLNQPRPYQQRPYQPRAYQTQHSQLVDRKQYLDSRQVDYQLNSRLDYYLAADVLFDIQQHVKLHTKTIFRCLEFVNVVINDKPDIDRGQHRLLVLSCLRLASYLNQEPDGWRLDDGLLDTYSYELVAETLHHVCRVVDVTAVTAYDYIELLVNSNSNDDDGGAIKDFCDYVCLAIITSTEASNHDVSPLSLVTMSAVLANNLLAAGFTVPDYLDITHVDIIDRILNLLATGLKRHKQLDDHFYNLYISLPFLPKLLSALRID